MAGGVSCGKQETEKKVSAPLITIVKNPVPTSSDSQFLVVNAEGDWTISLSYQGDRTGWANVNPKSGSGDKRNILFEWEDNHDEDARRVLLTIRGDKGATSTVLFTQKGTKNERAANSGVASTTLGWMELPATNATDGRDFFTRDMSFNGREVRNYSYYWDYDNLVAWWVAYPMIASYMQKNYSRSDIWQIDPMLAREQQPVVVYRGFGSAGCDRGHQIPAADRTFDRVALDDTFYGTNQTPQYSSFNQGIWSGVENKVRSWAAKSDTLYVVTGCIPTGSSSFAYDNDGKQVTIPTAYWKAVLSLAAGEYSACAIYLPHNASYSSSGNNLSGYCKSIKELENIIGYDLFVNLPAKVGASKANQIESENPSTVNWWWK